MERIIEQLRKEAQGIANTTAHFMALAESYIAKGNVAAARACLLLLCENCDNYEESIEWNGLSEQWKSYRYLVADIVSSSVKTTPAAPLSPEKCTMQIADILALPDDEILSALSEHLGELSGDGNALSTLNEWERTIYYVDELWMEINSGGFDSYLNYYGTHFEQAYTALKDIAALRVLPILDDVRNKFPKKRIPQNEEALQKAIDILEEDDIDFDSNDELFYSIGEQDLLKSLLSYIKENKQYLR